MNGEDNMERGNEAPFLESLKKENCFKVPDHYFDELAAQTLSRISIEKLNKESFSIPLNYFDTLTEDIQRSAKLNKLIEQADNQEAFKVPQHYFNNAKRTIIAETKSGKKSKIITISFIKYAAAACVLVASSIGLYLNNKQQSINYKIQTLPKEEIVNYLQLHTENNDVNVIIENLEDVSQLEEKVNNN